MSLLKWGAGRFACQPIRFAAVNQSSAPVLPVVGSSPQAVYGVSLLVSGYGGPLYTITRASDSSTLNVSANSSGAANTSAVAAFLSGTWGGISTLYDQSGNGLHATQSTQNLMPGFSVSAATRGLNPICFGMNGSSTQNTETLLTLPAGLSTSRQSVTVAGVIGTGGTIANGAIWSLGNNTTTGNSLMALNPIAGGGSTGANYGCVGLLGNTGYNFITPQPWAYQPCTLIVQSGSSNLKGRVAGKSTSLTAYTALAMTGGQLGQGIWSSSSYAGTWFFGLAIYPTQLSDTDCVKLETAFGTIFNIQSTPNYQVIWDGDSISSGFLYQVFGEGLVAQTIPLLSQNIQSVDIALNGQQMSTIFTDRTNASAKFNSGLTGNIVHIFAGTNDINNAASGSIVGIGTTTWTNSLLPYIQAMQTAGFSVVVGTLLPRNWGGNATDVSQKETERQAYNTLITSNAVSDSYSVIDYANIPQLNAGGTNNPPNLTYMPDGTHPNVTGYGFMVSLAAPVINALL